MMNKPTITSLLSLSMSLSVPTIGSTNSDQLQRPLDFASVQQATFPLMLDIRTGLSAEVEYRRLLVDNGELTNTFRHAHVEFLNMVEEGFIGRWTADWVRIGETTIDKTHELASRFFIGVPIEFVANYDGYPLKLRNRASLQQLHDTLFPAATLREDASDVFSFPNDGMDDESMASIFLPALERLSLCHSTDLPLKKAVTTRTEFSANWSNKPVPAEITYELTHLDTTSRAAMISHTLRTLDPEEMSQSKDRNGQPHHSEVNHCVVDTETGRVKEMSSRTDIKSAHDDGSDTYTIKVTWIDP